jgi:phosphoribosylaminoimidazolecarboxamide formyltransferase/IMP cyclohydrolase
MLPLPRAGRYTAGMQKTALLSVYDKQGIETFGRELVALGWQILASGGTAAKLQAAGVPVRDVAELVGGEAILGHRVVTLSRELHAGLLARPVKEDLAELARLKVPFIDLVCVDLYPLAAEIAKPTASLDSVLEQTDVGGPTMLRSAAKGQRIVVADVATRQEVVAWLKAGEPDAAVFRRQLAARAEATVSAYVLESARYQSEGVYDGVIGRRELACKYGENAWQAPAALSAALGSAAGDPLALTRFELVDGSEPSYNNLVDVDRLLQTITHIAAGFERNFKAVPAIAVGVKHGNACGAAVADDPVTAVQKMVTGDRRALFGGLVMVNFTIDEAAAEALLQHGVESGRRLLDGIMAPQFTAGAIKQLGRKGGKCRLLQNPALAGLTAASLDQTRRLRPVRGGFLTQPNYTYVVDAAGFAATDARDLVLAWAVGSTSNSNTVTLVQDGQLLGNGVGQQDRVGCCELAIKRATDAGHATRGAAAYSDSFFPFADGPMVLAEAGVRAILATSGSVRDDEVAQACKERGVTLYTPPDRAARGFFGH